MRRVKIDRSVAESVAAKVEEVARLLRDLQDTNEELRTERQQILERSKDRDLQLQALMEENEQLSQKLDTKTYTQARSTQTEICLPDMAQFDHSHRLEEELFTLKKKLLDVEKRNQYLECEIEGKSQEMLMLMKSQKAGRQSISTVSDIHQPHLVSQMGSLDHEELISRLNAKITQLKMNEDRLQEEIQHLKSQATLVEPSQSQLKQSTVHGKQVTAMEERLSEYEVIVLEQRQQLLSMADENMKLKRYAEQVQGQMERVQQEANLRLKNMSELKDKQEQINQMLSSQSEGGFFSQGALSQKSTQVDTERMRQYTQQLELSTMQMRHQLEELKQALQMTQNDLQQAREEVYRSDQIIVRLKQDQMLAKVGLINDGDAKLTQKVVEQRNKIKYLQGLLLRAKQDFDTVRKQQPSQTIFTQDDSATKIHDKIRREHQQAVLALIDLKEEYTNKLMIIQDKNESVRSKMSQENQTLAKKVEHLQQQLQYMEKKEMRLFGQLEEAKSMQDQETKEKETRTRELEELLFKKEETINELEREVKTKDKTIHERQEQIAILIGTLENEHSQDQTRQKLLNQSAELCSLKAIQASNERKINELNHQLKKSELNSVKYQRQLDQERAKAMELNDRVKVLENTNDELERSLQEMKGKCEERDRELNEEKFKQERMQYQLQMKDETLGQVREQIRRQEISFKEEVERIRKDFIERINQQSTKSMVKQSETTKVQGFKTAIQQLHICIADYLSNGNNQEHGTLIKEFERALMTASNTIEKLQNEIDQQQSTVVYFNSELKSTALLKIVMEKYETLQIKYSKLQQTLSIHEDEISQLIRDQTLANERIIRNHESKIDHLTKELNGQEESNSELKSNLRSLQDKNEELTSQLQMIQQEKETMKKVMEQKAELTVDERFKSKHEAIKAYFDSNITRILLNTGAGPNEKILELGREIVSLKLLQSKCESQLNVSQNEVSALDISLAHQKEYGASMEQRVREMQTKNEQLQAKLNEQKFQAKLENEKKKQEILTIEKDMMKLREQLNAKIREIVSLESKLSTKDTQTNGKDESDKLREQLTVKDQHVQHQQKQIDQLQDQLVELRSCHIQELEDLRVQYDLEFTEARRNLIKEKENLEKRFMPGYAPGDLMEQNQDLQNRIVELKQALDRIMQENTILRKKCESEKMNNEQQRNEIGAYKQALMELESTMIEATNQTAPNYQASQINTQRSQMVQQPEESKKLKISKKKHSLNFNRASDDDQYSQSKINHQDQSSLNVSALTSMNMIPSSSIMRPSSQLTGGQSVMRSAGFNPPQIVRALIQTKVQEMKYRKKCEELVQNEIELRSQVKENLVRLKESEYRIIKDGQMSERSEDYELQEMRRRLIELQLENEDLKMHRTSEQIDQIRLQQQSLMTLRPVRDNQYDQSQDYQTLIEAIISLVNQIANDEADQEKIEQAQRIVIRSLSQKLLTITNGNIQTLQFAPSEDKDKKLWYLELLEQQVNSSEQVIQSLQNFIKKLSIDIQGNLQSAAQIKAASMDLAQNTMKTSEEVKTLRHILGLIKHDLNKNYQNTQIPSQTLNSKTINPFENQNFQKTAYYDQLVQSQEQLQNQLTITEKVKKTLEQEIVSLKVNHAQELSHMNVKLNQALDQRNSLLQTNEELHDKVSQLQQSLDKLKGEITMVQEENQHNQTILMEKEKEKQLINQNKNATSKHLQKLQQDMHEWRRQTDENMKIKDNQINELTIQVTALTQERDRIKSENQMLRRNQKEQRSGEELKKLQNENKELADRLQKEIDDRKKEIEYWVTERATMRQMIDQLESEKVEGIMEAPVKDANQREVKTVKKKMQSKLKQKDFDLKNKERQIQELKDELTKVKLITTQLEQKLREYSSKQTEAEERIKYYSQKLKEVELERDLVLAERNNAIQTNDITAAQIQSELNSLRECFAKLKVERDNLLYEMESTATREKDWKSTVDKLNDELQRMESSLLHREREQQEQIRVLENKNAALLADMKFLKQENDKIKDKNRQYDQSQIQFEQKLHSEQMKNQEVQFLIDDLKKIQKDLQQQLKSKDENIKDLQGQLLQIEAIKMRDIDGLKSKIDEIKEANGQIIALYENQLAELRNRFIQDKKKTEYQVDQMFSLAQREAVIKNLKKELTVSRSQVAKLKSKNKDLKSQVSNQENQQTNTTAKVPPKKVHSFKMNQKDQALIEELQSLDKNVIKLAQMISTDENGYRGVFDQLQKTNTLMAQLVETKAEQEKLQNWNMVINQQLQEQQESNREIQMQMESLQKSQIKETKVQKKAVADNETVNRLKLEIRNLQGQIEQMKQEWLPPNETKTLQDKVKESQNTIKTLKDEVQRKKDVITQLKQQIGQTEVEANQILADMEGLKDDNIKLQKLIKENAKNSNLVKELKSTNDYLKAQEKKLKEEIISLTEKVRAAKLDAQRKEQVAREYKEKLDLIQDEVNQTKDKGNEIDRLKDINKKLKLEAEIKENQVKALKQRVEHYEEEIESLKTLNQSSSNMTNAQSQQLESQVKMSKNKVKKYEAYLKKSLEALKKIGKELSQQNSRAITHRRSSQMKHQKSAGNDNPMMISDFDKDFYKDSVNILGVSMDELEEFMNPSAGQSMIGKMNNQEAQNFMVKLDRVVEIPETLNEDIDQICNYCVKLIQEINPDISFK